MLFILSPSFSIHHPFSPFSLSGFVSFLPFLMFFHHKNKKYRNCFFCLCFSPFLKKQFTKIVFPHFSSIKTTFQKKSFLSFRCFFNILCFRIFNIKEKFSLPCLRHLFVLLCISSDFSLLFFIFDFNFVHISFFLFSIFSLYSLCVFLVFFFFFHSCWLFFFFPFYQFCALSHLQFCVFDFLTTKKTCVLTCLLVFSIPLMIFFTIKNLRFLRKTFFCSRHWTPKCSNKWRRRV